MDHTGQENIWFVGCSTTARATPVPGESGNTVVKSVEVQNKSGGIRMEVQCIKEREQQLRGERLRLLMLATT